MAGSYKFRWYLRAFGTRRAELESSGDAVIVRRIAAQIEQSRCIGAAVILAMDGVVDRGGRFDRARTEVYVPNEFVAAQVAKHPQLLFGASVNPYRRDALDRLNWARAHGAVLLKWLPAIQGIDPADTAIVPFYRRLAELGLPLLTHTGTEHSFTMAEEAYGDPWRLELALHQGVTVIAAHAATTGRYGGERAIDRLARLMLVYPNLYADISALTLINRRGDLSELVSRSEFRDRLVYGTDYPLVALPCLVSPWCHLGWISRRECREIAAIANHWDRDVALKRSLGVPAEVWRRTATVLGIHWPAFAAGF